MKLGLLGWATWALIWRPICRSNMSWSSTTFGGRPPRTILPMAPNGLKPPAELGQQSEIVLTSLPNPPIVEEVSLGANGLIHGMASGSVYIDLSTNSPRVIKQIGGEIGGEGHSNA